MGMSNQQQSWQLLQVKQHGPVEVGCWLPRLARFGTNSVKDVRMGGWLLGIRSRTRRAPEHTHQEEEPNQSNEINHRPPFDTASSLI
jgi:hypothetical protein